VYPTYRNTIYVTKWGEIETQAGSLQYPAAWFDNTDAPVNIFQFVMEHERVPDGVTLHKHALVVPRTPWKEGTPTHSPQSHAAPATDAPPRVYAAPLS